MFKFLIIGTALLAGWLYFTQSGNQAFSDLLEKSGSVFGIEKKPVFVPDQSEVRRLESLISDKVAKLEAQRTELESELKFRGRNQNKGVLRTDPIFLERGIKRLEKEKEALEAQLRKVNSPPPGVSAK